jgi:hypothetical protein
MKSTLGLSAGSPAAVTAPLAGNAPVRERANPLKAETAENIIRFALWMHGRKTYPSFTEVMEVFGVHRSSAHRMLNAYEAATGIERPRNPGGDR